MLQVEGRGGCRLGVLQLIEALAGIQRHEGPLLGDREDRRRHARRKSSRSRSSRPVVGRSKKPGRHCDASQTSPALNSFVQGLGVIALIGDGDGQDSGCDRQTNQEAALEMYVAFF